MTDFMDLEKSQPLTEDEFKQVLSSEKLIADYKGKSVEVKSMEDLLNLFGYSGETAGVYKLVLPDPYVPILGVLADPFLSVVPAEYLLGDKYEEAMSAAENGKNPSAWENYVQEGEEDPTHQPMHKYPVGTGPYFVKEYEENSYIVLELNPYYWNKDLWEKEYGYKP
jgi:peptide/nickel transport system substrate-binding protein